MKKPAVIRDVLYRPAYGVAASSRALRGARQLELISGSFIWCAGSDQSPMRGMAKPEENIYQFRCRCLLRNPFRFHSQFIRFAEQQRTAFMLLPKHEAEHGQTACCIETAAQLQKMVKDCCGLRSSAAVFRRGIWV
jgi:hypothetical protein